MHHTAWRHRGSENQARRRDGRGLSRGRWSPSHRGCASHHGAAQRDSRVHRNHESQGQYCHSSQHHPAPDSGSLPLWVTVRIGTILFAPMVDAKRNGCQNKQPNEWRISRAATVDRYSVRAESACQNANDLAAVKWRRAACACSAASQFIYC